MLEVNITSVTSGEVQLTDVYGRVIATAAVKDGMARLGHLAIAKGIYFVRFTGNGISRTVKVLKNE